MKARPSSSVSAQGPLRTVNRLADRQSGSQTFVQQKGERASVAVIDLSGRGNDD